MIYSSDRLVLSSPAMSNCWLIPHLKYASCGNSLYTSAELFLKHAEETKSNKSRNKSAFWGWCQPHGQGKGEELSGVQVVILVLISRGLPVGHAAGWGLTYLISSVLTTTCGVLITIPTYRETKRDRWMDLSRLYQGKPGFNSHLPDSNPHVFHCIITPFLVMPGESRCFPNADVHADFSAMNLAGLSSPKARALMSSDSEPSLTQPPASQPEPAALLTLLCVLTGDWLDHVGSWGMRANAAGGRSLHSLQRCQREDPLALRGGPRPRHVAERAAADGPVGGRLLFQGQPGLHAAALGLLQWWVHRRAPESGGFPLNPAPLGSQGRENSTMLSTLIPSLPASKTPFVCFLKYVSLPGHYDASMG